MTADIPQKMLQMLVPVAEALGDELLPYVAFVGGSTTALLISDPITRHAVRFTEDVDLILDIDGRAQWHRFQQQLRERGFKESMEENLTCRMMLGALKVDFMPADASILGFTNCWYHAALTNARPYPLTDQITINLLAPEYFIATKLEAYHGRGNNDPMGSHDLEDIINLVDGRIELLNELQQAEENVRHYIAKQFAGLLQHPDFEYAVLGNLQDAGRSELFFDRWEQIAALK
ncbi:nucleotidyl transferase AbiEii/AbiGii toxin family protein [Methylomarinum sp. Ch1-1]|uniref:Nucleotidyl transferase AbiEii/AbiGii toxin family protein n=1 Tax=Methylomarinum roseum TaxID=3067653 RepID=A0AAU7NVQ8_9GAMM|nr:nucleotidyl transferase AbiEii/AbiGii toxin family protein [Methylomarinum sp. Ch1-1]MDP4519262.1 nucleotidyl transferase AbiEii/AbiGii toxin family protein [Methylomarinum sp. Ch1-1]